MSSLQCIGIGAFGSVLCNEKHAIKKYNNKVWGSFGSKLLTVEVEFLSKLNSPYFPKFVSSSLDRRELTMEKIDGVPLRELKPVWCAWRAIIHQALSAVSYLHNRDIVHRDLKDDNILVSRKRVVIIDLGSAAYEGKPGIGNTHFSLSPPETLLDYPPTKNGDIWTLGVTFYEFLVPKKDFIYKGLIKAIKGDEKVQRNAKMLQAICERIEESPHPELLSHKYLSIRGIKVAELFEHSKVEFDPPIRKLRLNENLRVHCLVKEMLQTNPWDRITADKALKHDTFLEMDLSRLSPLY